MAGSRPPLVGRNEVKIEIKDDGNVHVDGIWLADVGSDTTWMREEAARFLAVADLLDYRRQPVWHEADKYAGDKYA